MEIKCQWCLLSRFLPPLQFGAHDQDWKIFRCNGGGTDKGGHRRLKRSQKRREVRREEKSEERRKLGSKMSDDLSDGEGLPLEVDMDLDRFHEEIKNTRARCPEYGSSRPRAVSLRVPGWDQTKMCCCLLIWDSHIDSHLELQSTWRGLERPVTVREWPGRHLWGWPNDVKGRELRFPLVSSLKKTPGVTSPPGQLSPGRAQFEPGCFVAESTNNDLDPRTRSPPGGDESDLIRSPAVFIDMVTRLQIDTEELRSDSMCNQTWGSQTSPRWPRRMTFMSTKVPKFAGMTNWKQYLQVFDAIVQSDGWDDATAGLQLLSHLEGDALNVALLVPELR